jgi:hypothetical protein
MERRNFMRGLLGAGAVVSVTGGVAGAAYNAPKTRESADVFAGATSAVPVTPEEMIRHWYSTEDCLYDFYLAHALNDIGREAHELMVSEDLRIGPGEVRRRLLEDGRQPMARVMSARHVMDIYDAKPAEVIQPFVGPPALSVPFASLPTNVYVRHSNAPEVIASSARAAARAVIEEVHNLDAAARARAAESGTQVLPWKMSRPEAVIKFEGFLLEFYYFAHVVHTPAEERSIAA